MGVKPRATYCEKRAALPAAVPYCDIFQMVDMAALAVVEQHADCVDFDFSVVSVPVFLKPAG